MGAWGRGGFGAPSHEHHHCRGRRGRSFGEEPFHEKKERSHSVSSSSSISSLSSSDSNGSLDDLPEYDDLPPAQAPLYASRLQAWVNSPDTIRTKQDLANLRAELKTVKSAGIDPGVDQKALKKQVKVLRTQWRAVREEQKRVVREGKREKKARKRAEKRERRERWREVKRSEREVKRESREGRREDKREQKQGRRERRGCGGRSDEESRWPTPYGVAGVPGIPGVPGQGSPFAPQMPHAPHTPHAPYRRTGSWTGMFGNRGGFGPQGSFGPQISVPHQAQNCSPSPSAAFNYVGERSAPPGAWPEDKKVRPEESGVTEGGQEAGVVGAPGREQKLKELEEEFERRFLALEELSGDKEKREGWKDLEVLIEKMDALKVEADEAYARELAERS